VTFDQSERDMALPSKSKFLKFLSHRTIPILFFVSALVTWPVLAEMELFEEFYKLSREYEDWDLDEFALLIVNLSVALFASVVFQGSKIRRISHQREAERRRAERNACHDPLTGLNNRRAFGDALGVISQQAKDGETRVMAVIDLDRFKPVNDLFGHAAGDATLVAVAQRLHDTMGGQSTLARIGGDEFSVIFDTSCDPGVAERLVRKMLLALEEAIEFEDHHIFIGCSIGLVKWGCKNAPDEALRQADKALYAAKEKGKGQFAWYDAELDKKSQERAEIEADLRLAILNSEIQPWFQPIIQIGTNKLVGFEVLARWTHATRGSIPPDVFIEIAEDSGQISKLGYALLQKACVAARNWDAALNVSFNISPYQFHDPRLVHRIADILADSAFSANRLTIEVTESAIIHDFAAARDKLMALKDIGISVALDDFGTGYSSLASLRKLPFDRIKIDRSFVTDIAREPQNQRIVSGIMALANGLDLAVTAEGIETVDDLAFLQALDCPLGQGYLFDKALPAEQVAWFLDSKWSDLCVDPNLTEQSHATAPKQAL
jgi:diguanylate cyclase (GGDEF)-like protein